MIQNYVYFTNKPRFLSHKPNKNNNIFFHGKDLFLTVRDFGTSRHVTSHLYVILCYKQGLSDTSVRQFNSRKGTSRIKMAKLFVVSILLLMQIQTHPFFVSQTHFLLFFIVHFGHEKKVAFKKQKPWMGQIYKG